MRIRPYYSDYEIKRNQYTFGNEWELEDGTEYIGLYHIYIPTNEIYTEAKWTSGKSKKLYKYTNQSADTRAYKKLKPDIITRYQSITPSNVRIPTKEEYTQGFLVRYFIKKYNESIVYEIDESQFNDWAASLIDPNLYTAVQLNWYITGEINDIENGPITHKGILTKNKESLKIAEKELLGISKLVTNLLEYYIDTDYNVPADINQQ